MIKKEFGKYNYTDLVSPEVKPPYNNLQNIKLQLHGAIYRNVSFVLKLRYCENLKTITYESTTLNRIVADKSHRVIVALH